MGPLCEQCDIQAQLWGKHWSKNGGYTCADCSQMSLNNYLIVAIFCWTMLSILLAIRSEILALQQQQIALTMKKMTKGAYVQQKSDLTGVYMKFITTYIQITSAVASFNLDVPDGIF